jgi:replicative DNA helicase
MLIAAGAELEVLPLTIDDAPGQTVSRIRQRALRHKRQRGLDLIIVDHLHLIGSQDTRAENRVQQLSAITKGLKGLAKEARAPVLALAQSSRAVEGRADKRPTLADLRESGSIEEDADVVLFLFREEYYVLRATPQLGASETHFQTLFEKWQTHLERVRGLADIFIAKNRQGATDAIKVRYDADRTRFENWTSRGEP